MVMAAAIMLRRFVHGDSAHVQCSLAHSECLGDSCSSIEGPWALKSFVEPMLLPLAETQLGSNGGDNLECWSLLGLELARQSLAIILSGAIVVYGWSRRSPIW